MSLVSAIREAFNSREKPASLTDSKELTNSEIASLNLLFEFDWDGVTGEMWEKEFDAINWFSPEAFCYYLPGLLKASIESENPNLMAVSSLISMLDRSPNPEWWDDFFLSRWPLLSIPECKAIQEWLFWLASCGKSTFSDDTFERALETIELLIAVKPEQ